MICFGVWANGGELPRVLRIGALDSESWKKFYGDREGGDSEWSLVRRFLNWTGECRTDQLCGVSAVLDIDLIHEAMERSNMVRFEHMLPYVSVVQLCNEQFGLTISDAICVEKVLKMEPLPKLDRPDLVALWIKGALGKLALLTGNPVGEDPPSLPAA